MNIENEKLLRERLTDANERLTLVQSVADFFADYLETATPTENPGRPFFDDSATALRIMVPMLPRYRQLFVHAATAMHQFVDVGNSVPLGAPLPSDSSLVIHDIVLLEDSLRDLLRAERGDGE